MRTEKREIKGAEMAKIAGYTELPFPALSALLALPAFPAFPAFSAFLLPAFSFSKCPNC